MAQRDKTTTRVTKLPVEMPKIHGKALPSVCAWPRKNMTLTPAAVNTAPRAPPRGPAGVSSGCPINPRPAPKVTRPLLDREMQRCQRNLRGAARRGWPSLAAGLVHSQDYTARRMFVAPDPCWRVLDLGESSCGTRLPPPPSSPSPGLNRPLSSALISS